MGECIEFGDSMSFRLCFGVKLRLIRIVLLDVFWIGGAADFPYRAGVSVRLGLALICHKADRRFIIFTEHLREVKTIESKVFSYVQIFKDNLKKNTEARVVSWCEYSCKF